MREYDDEHEDDFGCDEPGGLEDDVDEFCDGGSQWCQCRSCGWWLARSAADQAIDGMTVAERRHETFIRAGYLVQARMDEREAIARGGVPF